MLSEEKSTLLLMLTKTTRTADYREDRKKRIKLLKMYPYNQVDRHAKSKPIQ